jgi:hypothetical protein
VVGGERAGEVMGGTRGLTGGPGLPAEERREMGRGGAANEWVGVSGAGAGARCWAAWAAGGREGGAGTREGGGGRGPDAPPPRGEFFLFLFFYFLFLISHFYFYFFLSLFLLNNN